MRDRELHEGENARGESLKSNTRSVMTAMSSARKRMRVILFSGLQTCVCRSCRPARNPSYPIRNLTTQLGRVGCRVII
ncbi:hypothetical protein L195_g038121 [Trifolium pratense]|uniref:Uncharacterized protein n=1 Tax=Trifolium pratense TaxID=57577 RepID=A0A2K3LU78_TRIPR|nr:hypothetical protein L195_g038121 [Trifolium pratense]